MKFHRAHCNRIFRIYCGHPSAPAWRQAQQELRLKIIHDLKILIVYCVMEFINDNIIEIIFRKILFCQIFSLPQCEDRRKYHRLAGRFFFSMEKSITIRISDIPERKPLPDSESPPGAPQTTRSGNSWNQKPPRYVFRKSSIISTLS